MGKEKGVWKWRERGNREKEEKPASKIGDWKKMYYSYLEIKDPGGHKYINVSNLSFN